MTPGRPSRTAEWVCFMRAADQLSPPQKRIVDDPYAHWFLGKLSRARLATQSAGRRLVDQPPILLPGLTGYVQVRHRQMDEALLAHVDHVEQIVVLGAGYDMRAARFADEIGARPVFEVDFPATQERKRRVLKAHPELDVHVNRVSIDFQTERLDEVLVRAGFKAGRPTFFFWEGVSMYLRRAAVRATLQTLHALGGPGSALTMDFWYLLDDPDVGSTLARMSGGLLHVVGEPVTFGVHPEDCADFLARDGWRANDVASSDELRRRYVKDDRPVYRANVVVTAIRA